jgi:acetyltransferase-like isoleucine patch superfamily enzyme
VIIGDDSFIFSDVIIMTGVSVGQGTVVYPRSVVVKNVTPYALVEGNPAKFIRDRKKDEYQKSNYDWFAQ